MDHNPANTNTTTSRMMIPRFRPEYSMTSLIMVLLRLPRRYRRFRRTNHLTVLFGRNRCFPRPCHQKLDCSGINAAAFMLELGIRRHGGHVPHLRHEQTDFNFSVLDRLPGRVFEGETEGIASGLRRLRLENLDLEVLCTAGNRRADWHTGRFSHICESTLQAAFRIEDEIGGSHNLFASLPSAFDDIRILSLRSDLDRAGFEVSLPSFDEHVL